jgi:hypothetical protein
LFAHGLPLRPPGGIFAFPFLALLPPLVAQCPPVRLLGSIRHPLPVPWSLRRRSGGTRGAPLRPHNPPGRIFLLPLLPELAPLRAQIGLGLTHRPRPLAGVGA